MRSPDTFRAELSLRPLPDRASALLAGVATPPRLAAHLILVHDVAERLAEAIHTQWTHIALDSGVVALGSALHDIGKIQYPEELTFAGQQHEAAGEQLLLTLGSDPRVARIARTHGAWQTETDVELEDLLVALADVSWKGKRDDALEGLIVDHLAAATSGERWDVFLALDDIIERVSDGADQRVAWQSKFAVE